jgi:hypothetical protein
VIRLQAPTEFWLGRGTISQFFNAHGINDGRQIEIHTAEPLMTAQ